MKALIFKKSVCVVFLLWVCMTGCASTERQHQGHTQGNTRSWKVDDEQNQVTEVVYSTDSNCRIPAFCVNSITFDERYAPYYALLNDREKSIYREVVDAIVQLKHEVTLSDAQIADESFNKIQRAILNDQPELFWFKTLVRVQHLVRYEGESEKKLESVSYELEYNELAGDLAKNQEKINQEILQVIQQAKSNSEPVMRELIVHDYLVDNIQYVDNSEFDQNVYSALVNRKTVCTGYTRAFQMIMRQMGVPVYFISGYRPDQRRNKRNTLSEGDLHAWNVIVLNDKTYNVDVTNDFSMVKGPDGRDYPLPSYKYFNQTDKQFDNYGYIYGVPLSDGTGTFKLKRSANSSDATIDKIVDMRYLINRLSKIYPISEKNIVNNQDEFDRNSENQLMAISSGERKATVYSLITNQKTMDIVTSYDWKTRDKQFMNKIYQVKNVNAKDVVNETYNITDSIYLYINQYTLVKK